jgi:predicted DNA-binding transcriptional regulator YafY
MVRPQSGHLLTGIHGEDGLVRADRLIAILLMLQQRGQVTAGEVARELEVSERTARRDLDALGVAGVPIYSQQGRGGGWRLAGGGRTDLSGLTAAESRALFLAAGPSSSASPQLQGALRKLVRALPEPFRIHAETAASALVVDPHGWDEAPEASPPPPHLDALQVAVVEAEQVVLDYVARDRAASSRVVHPLGLVSKGPYWYLIAGTDAGLRTFRVDRITAVRPNGERVVRPAGFELSEAWRLISDEVDRRRMPLVVTAYHRPGAAAPSSAWCSAAGAGRRGRAGRPGQARDPGPRGRGGRRRARRARRPRRGGRAARGAGEAGRDRRPAVATYGAPAPAGDPRPALPPDRRARDAARARTCRLARPAPPPDRRASDLVGRPGVSLPTGRRHVRAGPVRRHLEQGWALGVDDHGGRPGRVQLHRRRDVDAGARQRRQQHLGRHRPQLVEGAVAVGAAAEVDLASDPPEGGGRIARRARSNP